MSRLLSLCTMILVLLLGLPMASLADDFSNDTKNEQLFVFESDDSSLTEGDFKQSEQNDLSDESDESEEDSEENDSSFSED